MRSRICLTLDEQHWRKRHAVRKRLRRRVRNGCSMETRMQLGRMALEDAAFFAGEMADGAHRALEGMCQRMRAEESCKS